MIGTLVWVQLEGLTDLMTEEKLSGERKLACGRVGTENAEGIGARENLGKGEVLCGLCPPMWGRRLAKTIQQYTLSVSAICALVEVRLAA